jgi:hypothetical protein
MELFYGKVDPDEDAMSPVLISRRSPVLFYEASVLFDNRIRNIVTGSGMDPFR